VKRSPLKRSKPLKRRVRLRAINRVRIKARRAVEFGAQAAMCRGLPCLVCGARPSDPHHVKSRGAGGRDEHCVPLCRTHHDYFHSAGRLSFETRFGVDLYSEAARLSEIVALNKTRAA
jgi:hypothetical protein